MTTGIYQFLNRSTNDRYIGGSTDIELTFKLIVRVLESKDRSSKHLASEFLLESQFSQDWFKYGREGFTLSILEVTKKHKSNISPRLKFWCRLLQPSYNGRRYEPIVSGVYQIINIKEGQSYIGQSKDIYTRWTQHKIQLRADSHPNKNLQASFNLHGESSFELRILEVYQPDLKPLVELEKQWIRKTDNLFNIVV
jgi:hypothetical protein